MLKATVPTTCVLLQVVDIKRIVCLVTGTLDGAANFFCARAAASFSSKNQLLSGIGGAAVGSSQKKLAKGARGTQVYDIAEQNVAVAIFAFERDEPVACIG